jgi:hypothetical protein
MIDCLRDSAAQGRLVLLTGAGISRGLLRADGGGQLPSWGELVHALRERADMSVFSTRQKELLTELLPDGMLDELSGDVLIEASELLQHGFAKDAFEEAIASICREKDDACSATHFAIARIRPSGIVTFNYDQAHERAFKSHAIEYQPIVYDEEPRLREMLAYQKEGVSFLLKAHGCVSRPKSLVLTSTSYRAVLSRNRAYRAFLQHILMRNTLLMVGFGLRDRDFDQVMTTLEIELGGPLRPHAIVTTVPGTDPEGLKRRAEWAAISARFTVHPVYVDNYDEIPDFIESLGRTPGPMVKGIVERTQSPQSAQRDSAHRDIERLGPIGRQQVKAALVGALTNDALDIHARSEVIYSLGLLGDRDGALAKCFIQEIERACVQWNGTPDVGHIECVAHALLALRRSRLQELAMRAEIVRHLELQRSAYRNMDAWSGQHGGVERLEAYAMAAKAEIMAAAAAALPP